MLMTRALRRAFTLVELMIVVALVGVLSTLAVYGVRRYITNAKTAEAKNALGQMGKDAVVAFESETMTNVVLAMGSSANVSRAFCLDSTVSVPSTPPKGAKYQSSKKDWSNASDVAANRGFPCLRFEMAQPQYYSYSYGGTTSPGTSGNFTALARGDLNGDGIASTFWLTGGIINSRATLAPNIGQTSPME